MEPLLDALDICTVAGATWDATPEGRSRDRRIDGTQTSSKLVVNLPKHVTALEVRELTRDLKRELNADHPSIILDLSDVREMDTAGLDLLVECLREALNRDGTVSLRGISAEAATILELTGLDRVLGMFTKGPECGANSEFGHMEFAGSESEEVAPKRAVV
jgi:anti-anti-sigma factor